MSSTSPSIPIISIQGLTPSLVHNNPKDARVQHASKHIYTACTINGFFMIKDYEHLLPDEVFDQLDVCARAFFKLPKNVKNKINMSKGGGVAWRGFFALGDEVTGNVADGKEGLYLGAELPADHPAVRLKIPLHGQNQFPQEEEIPNFKNSVIKHMSGCQRISHVLIGLISLSLGLPSNYFFYNFTHQPLELFRIFHYPNIVTGAQDDADRALLNRRRRSTSPNNKESPLGVGKHTDYGLLTLLKQDDVGGLQVQSQEGNVFIDVPPVPHTFVVNIGDMLELLTRGLFRSTPHRVLQPQSSNKMRVSYPFFFDPGFFSQIKELPLSREVLQKAADARDKRERDGHTRWDSGAKSSLDVVFNNNNQKRLYYGDYVMNKVSAVFPKLFATHILAQKKKRSKL